MSDKVTMRWEDWRGHEVTREVNQIIDVRDYLGTPGYALLLTAANTNLSVSDIRSWLEIKGVGRSRSWIQRRRWLFQQPDAVNSPGHPNADSKDADAIAIMSEHPTVSLRDLATQLQRHGITRSREWVRQHRAITLGGK
jgi:hypothetical protein